MNLKLGDLAKRFGHEVNAFGYLDVTKEAIQDSCALLGFSDWVKNGFRINEIFPNFLASALNVYSYRATELEPELGL